MNGSERWKMVVGDEAEVAVIRYLRQHPDFIERNSWILESLEIPHACGAASSLVERQVMHLRHRNTDLRTQMAALIGNARDNERLSRRLHELTLALIECPDRCAVMSALECRLRDEFQVEFVDSRFDDTLDRPTTLMPNHGPECGPITPSRWKKLFGTHPFGLRTAVLIPFQFPLGRAVLGLGSNDRERFKADMGTLFWEQLGETLTAVFTRLDL